MHFLKMFIASLIVFLSVGVHAPRGLRPWMLSKMHNDSGRRRVPLAKPSLVPIEIDLEPAEVKRPFLRKCLLVSPANDDVLLAEFLRIDRSNF